MRLIDADGLLGILNDLAEGGAESIKISEIIYFLNHMPTRGGIPFDTPTDAVQHGHWEMVRNGICNVDFRCSACRKFKFHNGEMRKVYKYCPNCGAIMEIEQEPAEQMHLF